MAQLQEAGAALAMGVKARGEGAPDVVLDALFGIGLSRPLPEEIVAAVAPILAPGRAPSPPAVGDGTAPPSDAVAVVAADLPSGLCSDSGRPVGPVVQADMTMTFVAPKLGQRLLPGLALCGDRCVAPLISGVRAPRAEATSFRTP